MAGDWIPWCKGLTKKPEVLAISRTTQCSRREVAAILCEFWEWSDSETDDGTLKGVALGQLEDIIPGTDGAFWLAVVGAGWLVVSGESLVIPNFECWLGRNAKSRLKERDKKRRQRGCPDFVPMPSGQDVRNVSPDPRPAPHQGPPNGAADGNAHRGVSLENKDLRPKTSRCHRDKNGTTGQDSTDLGEESPSTPLARSRETPAAEQPDPDPVVLTFPTVGKKPEDRQWHLRQSKLAEYRETFLGVDVLAECRKALQWCRDNPAKRKTARGMACFLGRWLSKEQDRGAGDRRPATPAGAFKDKLSQRLEGR